MAATTEKKSRNAARAALQVCLEQKLATLPDNAPLPPMRELKQEYNVGTTKLNTVISQMEKAGLVERKARSGIYKARVTSENLSLPYIDVVRFQSVYDTNIVEGLGLFTSQLISELTTAISGFGRGCRVHVLNGTDDTDIFREKIASAGMKAVVLVYQSLPDTGNLLQKNHVAWVSLMPTIHINDNRMIYDSPDTTQMQLEYLFRLGHTRIAYMDKVDRRIYSLPDILRRESFFRVMANRHLEVKEHWVQSPGVTEEGIRRALQAIFATEPYPTAMIVRDYDLPIAYRFVESIGLTPGKDVSFIASDDLPFVAHLHPAGTSVVNSPAIAAKMAVDTLTQIMAGNEPQQPQTIPLSIAERESASPVNKTE